MFVLLWGIFGLMRVLFFCWGSENTNKNKHLFFEGGGWKKLVCFCYVCLWFGGLVAWWLGGLMAWWPGATKPPNQKTCLCVCLTVWWPAGLMD